MKLITNLARHNVEPLPKARPTRSCGQPLCTPTSPCARCRGRDNRLKGLRKQATARKRLGIRSRFATHNSSEERWRGYFRVEVKSGKQVGPIFGRYLLAERQSAASKALGDTRPFLAVFMPDDADDGLVLLRLSTFQREIAPLLEP